MYKLAALPRRVTHKTKTNNAPHWRWRSRRPLLRLEHVQAQITPRLVLRLLSVTVTSASAVVVVLVSMAAVVITKSGGTGGAVVAVNAVRSAHLLGPAVVGVVLV